MKKWTNYVYRGDSKYKLDTLDTPNKVLGAAVLGAWRAYCMESWIFRLFVKLGWRK
tara:strand:+ start:71 stop:238 length:168 start_codon:yes stop_codon:yes gene_type:complete